jgi:hypothetical protein
MPAYLVFIIDKSGSMSVHTALLVQNLTKLIQNIDPAVTEIYAGLTVLNDIRTTGMANGKWSGNLREQSNLDEFLNRVGTTSGGANLDYSTITNTLEYYYSPSNTVTISTITNPNLLPNSASFKRFVIIIADGDATGSVGHVEPMEDNTISYYTENYSQIIRVNVEKIARKYNDYNVGLCAATTINYNGYSTQTAFSTNRNSSRVGNRNIFHRLSVLTLGHKEPSMQFPVVLST